MSSLQKNKKRPTRIRTPVFVFVTEGQNKTESTYFNHLKCACKASIKTENSQATDIKNMAKRSKYFYGEYQLDKANGDCLFCLVDLDANENKVALLKKVSQAKEYENIKFIASNPCFEVWFLFHKEANPKNFNSSDKVKEYIKKYIPDYEEKTDVYERLKLKGQFATAVDRAEKKALIYERTYNELTTDWNPYTQVLDIMKIVKPNENF